MIDKTGAYGFSWREWLWFAALFCSFFIQATLVSLAYRNMRRRISHAVFRINMTSLETRKLVDAMWDDVAYEKKDTEKKNRWRNWSLK